MMFARGLTDDGQPSLHRHLPAADGGALILLILRAATMDRRSATRNMALIATIVTFVLSLFIWGNFDPQTTPASSSSRRGEWIGGLGTYKMGVDGISMLFVMLTTFLMPLVHRWPAGRRSRPRQGIHDRVPDARNADDRRVLALDLVLFYLFFEGGPDPDVPDHRHLGRQGPDLRGDQVLPLHASSARS